MVGAIERIESRGVDLILPVVKKFREDSTSTLKREIRNWSLDSCFLSKCRDNETDAPEALTRD